MNRLSAEAVVDELVAALKDQESYRNGRIFQARLVAGQSSEPMRKLLDQRHPELIDLLVKLSSENGLGADWLLAAACELWRRTERPVTDFAGLQPMIDRMIDEGFKGTPPQSDRRGQQSPNGIRPEWYIVVTAAIEKVPQAPDLAIRILKHSSKDDLGVLQLVGKLGRHAEPAVPALVDEFLTSWKKHEAVKMAFAMEPRQSHPGEEELSYRKLLVTTLGEIGVGAKGYELLRELKLTVPPTQQLRDDDLFRYVTQALSKFAETPEPEDKTRLLSDQTLINGLWKPKDSSDPKGPLWIKDMVARHPGPFNSEQRTRSRLASVIVLEGAVEVDSKSTPRKISFAHVEPNFGGQAEKRDSGIYELTDTTLRIQLAPRGQPAPTEFAAEAVLPEGHMLFEFTRETVLAKTSPGSQ